jgi:hypothetical protein
MDQGGGLFIEAQARQLEGVEVEAAWKIFNARRQALLRESVPIEYFTGDNPQRLYCAEPLKLWVNLARRDQKGHILEDIRHEITSADLRVAGMV